MLDAQALMQGDPARASGLGAARPACSRCWVGRSTRRACHPERMLSAPSGWSLSRRDRLLGLSVMADIGGSGIAHDRSQFIAHNSKRVTILLARRHIVQTQ